MCGFIAIFSKQSRQIDRLKLQAAMTAVRHRGPDDSSDWIDPRGHVAFGYVRLGLVGLSNGRQPIVADEGDLVLMVNGEFYDYAEIRQNLKAIGCKFKTDSDSEIIMHLYRREGIKGLEKLRGDFAIVIYDRHAQSVTIVRDRVGVKPLYYAEHEGLFYCGSEIKALLQAGIPGHWDCDSYASRGFILHNDTLFSKVKSVKPGSLLIIDQSGIKEKIWWDWSFPNRSANQWAETESDMVEQVRRVIEGAVQIRLHAEAPIGVSLSGGLDSAAMLGLATVLTGKSLDAFHLCFEDESSEEELSSARLAATHNGATLHVLRASGDTLADRFEGTVWHVENPFTNANSIAKYALNQYVKGFGVRALLTGEGADEVFGGYPHFKRDMAKFNNEGQEIEAIRELVRRIDLDGRAQAVAVDTAWQDEDIGHGISWLQGQAAIFSPIAGLYSADFVSRAHANNPYKGFVDRIISPEFSKWDPVNKSIYALAKSGLPNVVLTTLGDRLEMASSLEGRPALLDHHVIETANKLPVWMKIRGNTEKYVLREAMKRYLPEEIYFRKKKYFRAPNSVLRKGTRLHQLVCDTLASSLLESLPFFDSTKVRRFSADTANLPAHRRGDTDQVLMELTSLCLMQKNFRLS